MKAIRFHEHGGPDVLRLDDVPDPEPGEGQMVVRVRAAGVNFIDVYQRQGEYRAELPRVPGTEGAGDVLAVGNGVTGFAPGDRVAFYLSTGSYGEQTLVDQAAAVRLPEGLSYETGAALHRQGMTAHFLSHSTYTVKEGEWVLVHAGAGGVGLLLTQMVKMRGGHVIATVSTEEKADLAREAGADEVVLYTEQDFVAEVKRITAGAGVPVVYDSVGRTTFDGSLDCLQRRGYLVLFGQSSGPVPPVDPQTLNAKGAVYLTRPNLYAYMQTPEELDWRRSDVFGWAASGALKVHIGLCLPLAEAAEAHRRLENRETTGKVVLLP